MLRIQSSLSPCWVLISALLISFTCLSTPARAQSTGTVSGTVVDQETGETLIGVNVRVEGTSFGTATDIEGSYRLSTLQPGTYTLIFSYIGYQRKNLTGVQIAADSVTTVDIKLASESVELGEVTVEARAIRNSEAILLKDRQKAADMSNAISAEEMSLTGVGTASEAMKKVTGASVIDGKYVQIRGLGDRYINTQLNGAPLPSSDPDKNSVPLDLFPSGMLDNIITQKTFTPDQPGDFTGGSVNIGTKSYPESFTFSLSSSVSHNTQVGRYILPGQVSETDSLSPNFQLTDQSGSDEVLLGGMASINYKLFPSHTLRFNYMRNHSATSEARFLSGSLPRDLTTDGATYQTRTLHYTERDIESYQLRGRHNFGGSDAPTLEWNGTLAQTTQNEPDLRYFSSNYTPFAYGGTPDTVFVIRPSIYSLPARYFRDLDEQNLTTQASLRIPFRQWGGLRSSFKIGGTYSDKSREFRERHFEYHQDAINFHDVRGRPSLFWSEENIGIKEEESREGFWRFGNYINEQTTAGDSYDGDQQIYAGFGMVDLQVVNGFRVITGVRYEGTDMVTASLDTTKDEGYLETNDWLPSVNMVYSINDRMNLRAAYGRTIARPTFREMAPYSSFAFVNDFIFTGNPELERTLVNNYDLRWEWFPRSGEIFAVSTFYKDFNNPIERVILNTNGEIKYQNVTEAQVVGLEFEMSKELDQISPWLEHLSVGTNLTLTHSQTRIAPSEPEIIRAFDPNADDTRPMQGESPYVFNLDLTYSNPESGTDIGAYYHVYGERQVSVSLGGTPDLYEQPSHQVDLNVSQRLWGGFSASASISNLLGNAPTNAPTTPHIEGIPESEATAYGGSDPADDSGIFRYLSIRHGGQALAPGNEINGLTFGGVGSRTTVEYVEVYNNQDDCFEWFGGFCGDDAFDYDQGFSGKGQFWFTIQPAEVGQGNRAGEHDGGDTEKTAQPYSTPPM